MTAANAASWGIADRGESEDQTALGHADAARHGDQPRQQGHAHVDEQQFLERHRVTEGEDEDAEGRGEDQLRGEVATEQHRETTRRLQAAQDAEGLRVRFVGSTRRRSSEASGSTATTNAATATPTRIDDEQVGGIARRIAEVEIERRAG